MASVGGMKQRGRMLTRRVGPRMVNERGDGQAVPVPGSILECSLQLVVHGWASLP